MISARSFFPAVVMLSLVGAGSPGITYASPSDGAASGSCSWVLSPPQVVQVSDIRMVLATVKPGPCTMNALPNQSVVCLSIQGGDSQGQCGNKSFADPAIVYLPYRPGATYVAAGQGCADLFENPVDHSTTGPVSKICESLGPMSFSL